MIYGLTHQENGAPIQRLTVAYRVSIGMPADNNRNYPQKLDHFRITTKDGQGEWKDDSAFYEKLRQAYMPEVSTDNGPRRAQLREFDIVFLSNDIDEILHTELAWWAASEKKCSGNGRDARRSLTALDPKQRAEHDSSERYVDWHPCGDACPDLQEGRCKPSASLFFIFKDRPIIGSVAAYYTTSYETIRRLHSSLLQIISVTGGRLRGIPLKMVLRPGRTRYHDDQGKTKTGNAFFVNIEFRQEDYSKLVPALLHESIAYETAVVTGRRTLSAARIVPTAGDDESPTIVEGNDDELAPGMVSEFYPQNRGDGPETAAKRPEETTATEDQKELHGIWAALGLNAAQQGTLFETFKGDIGAALQWMRTFRTAAKDLGATGIQIHEWFGQWILRPAALAELIQNAKAAKDAPKGESAAKGGKAKTVSKKKTEPPPPPPVTDTDRPAETAAASAPAPPPLPPAEVSKTNAGEQKQEEWTNF